MVASAIDVGQAFSACMAALSSVGLPLHDRQCVAQQVDAWGGAQINDLPNFEPSGERRWRHWLALMPEETDGD